MFILHNDLGNKLTLIGFLGYNIISPKRSADKSDDEARNVKKATCGRGGNIGRTRSAILCKEVTDKELNKVLKALEQIPNEKERDDAMQIVLKAASESITLERLKKISSFREEEKKKEEGQGFIKFTKKEIESMPEIIQRLFVFDEKSYYIPFCSREILSSQISP